MAYLITVVVLEESRSGRLAQGLAQLLGRLVPVAVAGPRCCQVPGEPPALLVYPGGEGAVVRAPRTMAVLSPQLEHCPGITLPEDARVLLPSQNPWAARFASQGGFSLVDCGLTLRDTLTLSSHTQLESVVTLQRSVEDLWGRPVEPVDLPLPLGREYPAHLLLYLAGVCLLAGWTQRLAGL